MNIKESLISFWNFLKEDSWQSLLVSLVIIIIFIKFILFPLFALITGSSLPLVVVESCSMYHASSFEGWWNSYSGWYEYKNVSKQEFQTFKFQNGLNKGDIIIVFKSKNIKPGDVIIFTPKNSSQSQYPIIHRVISINPIQTKGDNNPDQLKGFNTLTGVDETNITSDQIIGKAVMRIPLIGWIKLIWFEPLRTSGRGFCTSVQ